MTFIGAWERGDFEKQAAGGTAESLFDRMCPDWAGSYGEFFGGAEQAVAFYAFRCRHCGALRGNLDGA